MKAEIVAITQPLGRLAEHCKTAEDVLVFVARVSNPSNQENTDTGGRLLKYCLDHKHFSIFETVNVTFEIETSRAIAAQVLRHKSLCFQEFSQRYAVAVNGHEPIELRMKGATNRQGSMEPAHTSLQEAAEECAQFAERTYHSLIAQGVAPESARMILPMATTTTMFATGNLRSWIFYFAQRCDAHAQKEHRELALLMRSLLAPYLPVLAEALNWNN